MRTSFTAKSDIGKPGICLWPKKIKGPDMDDALRSPRYALLRTLLTDARKKAGLTQTDLAGKLERSQSFISDYETGVRYLDVIDFIRIADALKLNAGGLISQVQKVR